MIPLAADKTDRPEMVWLVHVPTAPILHSTTCPCLVYAIQHSCPESLLCSPCVCTLLASRDRGEGGQSSKTRRSNSLDDMRGNCHRAAICRAPDMRAVQGSA